MGFDGKTLIHPSQVDPANAAWTPAPEDVAEARRVIAAFTAAEAEGRGVATVDGRMIEALHVETARRTLAIADAVARSECRRHPSASWRGVSPLRRPPSLRSEGATEVTGGDVYTAAAMHLPCGSGLWQIHGATHVIVTFHGVRGSTPCQSDDIARHGGNTACVSVQSPGEQPLLFDLGTGLALLRRVDVPDELFDGTCLLSHLHWDHVQGLPFFQAVAAGVGPACRSTPPPSSTVDTPARSSSARSVRRCSRSPSTSSTATSRSIAPSRSSRSAPTSCTRAPFRTTVRWPATASSATGSASPTSAITSSPTTRRRSPSRSSSCAGGSTC